MAHISLLNIKLVLSRSYHSIVNSRPVDVGCLVYGVELCGGDGLCSLCHDVKRYVMELLSEVVGGSYRNSGNLLFHLI